MSDIATVWNATQGDWLLEGADLRNGDDLATAALISLFSDRVADPDDALLDASNDPRGWWGDGADHSIGSRLWLIERAKRTQQTLQAAKGYIEEALQWMLDDGVAAGFEIGVEWDPGNQLSASVVVLRSDGQRQAMRFAWAWNTPPRSSDPASTSEIFLPRLRYDGTVTYDGAQVSNGVRLT